MNISRYYEHQLDRYSNGEMSQVELEEFLQWLKEYPDFEREFLDILLDEKIHRYLSKEMSENESEEFQETIKNSAELKERLKATALLIKSAKDTFQTEDENIIISAYSPNECDDELIEKYLCNKMDNSERIDFENRLLIDPELKDRLKATAWFIKISREIGKDNDNRVIISASRSLSKKFLSFSLVASLSLLLVCSSTVLVAKNAKDNLIKEEMLAFNDNSYALNPYTRGFDQKEAKSQEEEFRGEILHIRDKISNNEDLEECVIELNQINSSEEFDYDVKTLSYIAYLKLSDIDNAERILDKMINDGETESIIKWAKEQKQRLHTFEFRIERIIGKLF